MRHLTCGFARLMLVQVVATAVACADPDPDALWRIVHDQCVPDQLNNLDPAPCVEVDLSAGEERGYAVLKDSDGRDQFLLIPTARLTGIEDPALRDPGASDYFEYAWQAKAFTESAAGGTLPRDWIGPRWLSPARQTPRLPPWWWSVREPRISPGSFCCADGPNPARLIRPRGRTCKTTRPARRRFRRGRSRPSSAGFHAALVVVCSRR